MEGHHNTEDGPQQSDVRGIGGHRAYNDQAFGQRHFKCLNVRELGQVHASIVEPPLDRHCHRPDAERYQHANNSIFYRILQQIHSSILRLSCWLSKGAPPPCSRHGGLD